MDSKNLDNYVKSNNCNFPLCYMYPENSPYTTTNGQNWNRRGSPITKKYKLFVIPENLKMTDDKFRYIHYNEEDYEIVKNILNSLHKGKTNRSIGIIILGYNNNKHNAGVRIPFSKDIIEKILNRDKMCVVCSSKTSLEVDHKDQDYIKSNKQLTENDGQVLCSKCNKIKRGGNSNDRKYELPPCINSLKQYNNNNFWYDPVKWINACIKNIVKKKDMEIEKLKNRFNNELNRKDIEIEKLKKRIEELSK